MKPQEKTVQQGLLKIIEHKLKNKLSPSQLNLVKQSAIKQLRKAFDRTSELSMHFYDKNARSQKVVSLTKTQEHEQDRNR